MSMRVISWEEYIGIGGQGSGIGESPLAVTIGVFDGVHRGHQSLIQKICSAPTPELHSPTPDPRSPIPTVVTFRETPQKVLNPGALTAEITNLDQKMGIFEDLGVQLAVLIDFSAEFSKINGRGFIDLLLRRPVKLIALGRNFRCGYRLDTGVEEIRSFAGERGVEMWVAPPVMDGGQPVSSSRIRQALAAGRQEEAERLLGRSLI